MSKEQLSLWDKIFIRFSRKQKMIGWLLVITFILYILGNFIYSKIFRVVPDITYFLMETIEEPKEKEKILFFAPHPDDETLAGAGFIARAKQNQSEIKVIFLSDGNKRGKGKQRILEAKEAARILGLNEDDLIFLNLEDGKLAENKGLLLKKLEEKKLKEFGPDLIILPFENDEHSDHRISSTIEQAFKEYPKIKKLYYLVHFAGFPYPRKLKTDKFLLPPSALIFDCQWKKFPLADEEVEKKSDALYQHKTQLSVPIEKTFLLSFVRQNELFCEK